MAKTSRTTDRSAGSRATAAGRIGGARRPAPRGGAAAAPWTALLLLALLIAAGFSLWARHRFECDDAYISYRYARHLAAGEGLVFNPGDRVEGYSNFLWVLMLAGGDRLGIPPDRLAPALGVASYLLLLALGWAFVWRGVKDWRPDQRALAGVLLFGLAAAPGFAASAGSGLATHFFALLVLGAAASWALAPERPRPFARLTPLLLVLLVLTRPDGLVPAAALLGLEALRGRSGGEAGGGWRGARRMGWPPALAVALHWGWRMAYYGSFFPNPYFAKAADASHWRAGLRYLGAFLVSYPIVAVCLVCAAVFVLRARSRNAGTRLASAGLAVAAAYALFLARLGGDFMAYRMGFHVLPLVALGGIVGLASILPRGAAAAVAAAALVLGCDLAPVRLESRYYMQSLEEMDRYVVDGAAVGRTLAGLPPDTRVATTLIGTIGYYSGLPIVDQWGLVDRRVRDKPARRPFVRGHLKFTAGDEAFDRGTDLYLEHPKFCDCGGDCVRGDLDVAIRLDDGRCIKAFAMSTKPGLRERICAGRDRFPEVGRGICARAGG